MKLLLLALLLPLASAKYFHLNHASEDTPLKRLLTRILKEPKKDENSVSANGVAPEVKKAIEGQEKKYRECFSSQDFECVLTLYTDDCYYYAPFSQAIHTKKALNDSLWKGEEKNPPRLHFASVLLTQTGVNNVLGHGEWYFTHKGENHAFMRGHFVTSYLRVKGDWLVAVDIINISWVKPGEEPKSADEDTIKHEEEDSDDDDEEDTEDEDTESDGSDEVEELGLKRRTLVKKLLKALDGKR